MPELQTVALAQDAELKVANTFLSTEIATTNFGRDNMVESLRVIACIVVTSCHFCSAFLPRSVFSVGPNVLDVATTPAHAELLQNPVFNLATAGNFAVCLFFVLSGYILTKPFFALARPNLYSLQADALKRLPRLLLPLMFFTGIAILLGLSHVYESVTWKAASLTGSSWFQIYYPSAATTLRELPGILLSPFENAAKVLPPAWTIATELIGSLLSYGLAAIIHSTALAPAIVLACFVFAPGYLKLFVLGTFYAFVEKNYPERLNTIKDTSVWIIAPLFLTTLFLASYPYYVDIHVLKEVAPIYLMVGNFHSLLTKAGLTGGITSFSAISLFLIAKLFFERGQWVNWLAPLGKHTYTTYLSHVLILSTIAAWTFSESYLHWHLRFGLTLASTFLSYLIGITICCVLFTDTVDGQSIRLARRLKLAYKNSLRL